MSTNPKKIVNKSKKIRQQIQKISSANPKNFVDKSKIFCPEIHKFRNPKIHIFWKIRSFWNQRISGSSFRCQDIARNPKKSRNPKIKKSRNPKRNFFGKSKKPLKIRSFWHQRISGSSFRCWDILRVRLGKKRYGRTDERTRQFQE